MRSAMKQAVLLLLLGAVVSNAEPECEALPKSLLTAEQDKIFGDWVLVWAVASGNTSTEEMKNTISSHLELRLLSDNQTILFHERNLYRPNNSSCVSYIFNMTVLSESEQLLLQTNDSRREASHRDVDEQKTSHDFLKKHAECLDFPTEQPFVYDGVSDFCHKKSAPEVKAEES